MNNETPDSRLHALDAVRGFALLLGVAFHAALSFMPGWPPGLWAMSDSSTSQFLSDAAFVSHIFRMSLFFFIAGFFARLLQQKLGTRGFVANRSKRILVPLVAGWIIVCPLIMVAWMMGAAKMFNGAPPPPPPMPEGWFPLTHLWFLYLLSWLYVAALAGRALVARIDGSQTLRGYVDKGVAGSIGYAPFFLGIPLAAALMSLPVYFYWSGIPTPDQSLVPNVPAVVGYGTAFVFGWLVHRVSGAVLPKLAARWFQHIIVAVIATAYLLYVVKTTPMAQPDLTKNVYALVFGVAAWSWVLGLTGAALRFLSGFSATRRYIADASYWVYIMHLPVVAALQVWVGRWPVHWSVKFPLILVISFAILFLSYHFLVRSTFIGKLLNGRKYPRNGGKPTPTAPSPAPAPAPAPTTPAPSNGGSPVAELRGVVKRYGSATALAGVDVRLERGELLALLGPNGAGKSTAISLWLGLNEADAGEVRLLGGSPEDLSRRRQLGVMMQDVELVKELRVHELISLSASYYEDPMGVEEVMKLTGTAPLARRLYGKLSGGQKRQVQFALAIVGRPRVLFLDEPTVGLDVQAREALWANIRTLLAQGCSIVLTTHYLEEAEALADRVVVIAKGRVIASGSVDDLRSLVARRQISCETRLLPDDVRAWPGVVDAAIERQRLTITAFDAEGVVRRLLAADQTLKRLEVREAGLAEAFNEITKEAA